MAHHLQTWIGSALFAAGLSLCAAAGPATAAPAEPCSGPRPVAGVHIRGPVLHVIDGETICVALGYAPDAWIRLRLADAPAALPIRRVSNRAEADPKRVMMAAAFAKMAECRTELDADRQVVAVCAVDGVPLGRALRDGSVIAAGMSWR
jgi:hypothetical protein